MNYDDLNRVNNLAKSFFDQKDFFSALKILSSVQLPDELIPNLAKCYYYTSQADKALELILPLKKTTELWIDVALYYNAIGKKDKAFDIYQNLDQNNNKVKFNLGWHFLSKNKFKKGFHYLQYGAYENAWGHEYIYLNNGRLKKEKRWQGNFVNELLLILEGGLGDEMIFLRWANHLKSMCNKLTILCNKSLLRLFINSGYNCEQVENLNLLNYDAYVPAMSLPSIIDINHPKEFVSFPYIKSYSENFILSQFDKIAKGRKKIGVKFYGNKKFEHDQFRSPPREKLEKLANYGQLFSLQLEEENEINLPNTKHFIKDWQDTYNVFEALDFVVTSCTSTAHLAGAMGKKAFVLVPLVPYFVWASDDMTWYNENIKIVRQTKYNDWSDAIEELFCLIKTEIL